MAGQGQESTKVYTILPGERTPRAYAAFRSVLRGVVSAHGVYEKDAAAASSVATVCYVGPYDEVRLLTAAANRLSVLAGSLRLGQLAVAEVESFLATEPPTTSPGDIFSIPVDSAIVLS